MCSFETFAAWFVETDFFKVSTSRFWSAYPRTGVLRRISRQNPPEWMGFFRNSIACRVADRWMQTFLPSSPWLVSLLYHFSQNKNHWLHQSEVIQEPLPLKQKIALCATRRFSKTIPGAEPGSSKWRFAALRFAQASGNWTQPLLWATL